MEGGGEANWTLVKVGSKLEMDGWRATTNGLEPGKTDRVARLHFR